MPNPLQPTASLLAKIGSFIFHVEEAMSSKAHKFDVYAMQGLLNDAEVKAWLEDMRKLAMIPEKR